MLTFNEITILSIKMTLNQVARRPKGASFGHKFLPAAQRKQAKRACKY